MNQDGGARVPFVVVARIKRLAARLHVLARRVPQVEAGDGNRLSLAAEHRLTQAVPQRKRLVDLGAAEHPAVSGASAWAIVEVARSTSTTIAVGARSASVGVKATCTRIGP